MKKKKTKIVKVAKKKKTAVVKAIVPFPAVGDIILGGVGIYGLACGFIALSKQPLVKLSSFGFGDVVDVSDSEIEGNFFGNPFEYVGACHYTLKELDFEAGVLELTIRHKKHEEPIGLFTGPSEGFGEAFVTNKKGHLSVHNSEHKNKVDIKGKSGIWDIQFHLEDECITAGQPYDGVDSYYTKAPSKSAITIDVKCGRHSAKEKNGVGPASYFKNCIGNNYNHMIGSVASSLPSALNFTIQGTLTINGTDYDVCLGQGHTGARNPWYFGSNSLNAPKQENGILGGAYSIKSSGYSAFEISKL